MVLLGIVVHGSLHGARTQHQQAKGKRDCMNSVQYQMVSVIKVRYESWGINPTLEDIRSLNRKPCTAEKH